MKLLRAVGALVLFCASAFAQLTQDQKVADLMQLSSIFAKNYTPYEWKRDALHYDMLDLKPWLARIAQSKTDIDFYEILSNYVSSLQDAQAQYVLPSDFTADLRISVDIYDGKVLLDGIDRISLPAKTYPFQIGDELVSVDGQTAIDLAKAYSTYNTFSNPIARNRFGASLITFRLQELMPHAADVGDTAKVVVARQNGAMETYDIPWIKTGTPLKTIGPVPSPQALQQKLKLHKLNPKYDAAGGNFASVMGSTAARDQNGFDGLKATLYPGIVPLFNLPAGFKLRLGTGGSDAILTGTFQSGNYTIGLLRIPDLSLSAVGQRQFQSEIAYFQQNTDGLVIDIMGVPTADFCVEQSLLTYLIPHTFGAIGYQVRATQYWVNQYAGLLQTAVATRSAQWVLNLYALYLQDIQTAFAQTGGKTGSIPFCGPTLTWSPATDTKGNNLAYTKPITLLTDEVSIGDVFAAILQDEQRAQIVGQRTSGLGGGGMEFDNAGNYSEGIVLVNLDSLTRNRLVTTSDFPVTNLIENVGVRPDITLDFQTKDNLLNAGKPFLDAVTAAAVKWIQTNQ